MSLVLIVADSVRHDAWGCSRAAAAQMPSSRFALPVSPLTPTIDQLASEGFVFERTITAAPWTVPSLASMLTGVYAHRLGLVQWEQPWPADIASLFHLASSAGAEVASFVFDPTFLFSRVPEARVAGSSQDTELLLGWLQAHRGKPFFLVIHYWWTHIPYVDKPMNTLDWRRVSDQVLAVLRSGPDARAGVQRLYAHAVEQFSEKWLPRVLEAAGLDDCWVALTADHGESWGERDETRPPKTVFDLHGNDLFEEVLNVPLVVRPPGGTAGRRIPGLTRSVDLTPTLAHLLGWQSEAFDADIDGVDLSACLLEGVSVPVLDAISVRNHDYLTSPTLPADPQKLYGAMALTTDSHRQIWEPLTGERRAFSLVCDPSETDDLESHRTGHLEAGWLRLQREFARAVVGERLDLESESLRARFRGLGYLE